MISPTLLVLAAGMGSRYGGLKQMDPVGPVDQSCPENGRETILDYSVYDALRAGFGRVVFVIRRDMEASFKEIVAMRFQRHIAVEYVFQDLDKLPPGFSAPSGRTKPWGTTHAILMAANAINEPFAVINADDFYGAEGYRVLAQYLRSGMQDYAMVGFVLRNTLSDFGAVARGVCQVSSDGFLEGVAELTKIERDGAHARNTDASGKVIRLSGDEIVSMNMWGFTPHVFEQLRDYFQNFLESKGTEMRSECYLPSAVNEYAQAGSARVTVLRTHDSWFGVTYREDHPRVVENIGRLIREGIYPQRLWS
jgi:UTP-glucose-1-phosphate uridylyltransferase